MGHSIDVTTAWYAFPCARMMAEIDSGVPPVGEDNRLVGMLTDRDIALRGWARRAAPAADREPAAPSRRDHLALRRGAEAHARNSSQDGLGSIQARRAALPGHQPRSAALSSRRLALARNGAGPLDLVLQLDDAVKKLLCRGRTARHNAVAAAHHGVRVVVVAAAIGARAH
jgi:CBS domain-containing protein